jgi:hypothetical protein
MSNGFSTYMEDVAFMNRRRVENIRQVAQYLSLFSVFSCQ